MFKFIREYYEMKRGLGDILLLLMHATKGKEHDSLKSSNLVVNDILRILHNNFEIISDNIELNPKK